MDNERKRAKEMVKNLPFKEKMKHYWGYYKKHVIVFVFSAVIVIWGLVQCMNRPVYDLNIACYTTRAYPDEAGDKFAEYIEKYVDEINDNGSKDVFVMMQAADITKDILQPEDHAVLSKMGNELSADEYKIYILDQPYLEHFQHAYGDIIQQIIPLHEIPEMKNMFGIREGESLYMITLEMFERSTENKEKVAEYNNVMKTEEHFMSLK